MKTIQLVRPRKAKSPSRARLGDYELHRSAQGFYSIRQISSGEIMHSVTAPSEEANKLYIEQSALAARLMKRDNNADELVIWDVGLGAATNAMAAIHCFERCYDENHGNEAAARAFDQFRAQSRSAHPRRQAFRLLAAPAPRRAVQDSRPRQLATRLKTAPLGTSERRFPRFH